MLTRSAATIGDACEQLGRPRHAVRMSPYLFISCHPDRDVAFSNAVDRLGRQYAQDFEKQTARYVVVGTPTECADRLAQYVAAGADALILASACPANFEERHQELLAAEVVPAFG
jgi:alkanesulfonate monooxygenase SsuD/methylene tetrahydromethanopterin reductase-like flavin-dependent oxidoreductase (luciferase family)